MKSDTTILIYSDLLHDADSGSAEIKKQWRIARDRIVFYLDALKIEPVEALNLSLRVLDETRKNIHKEGGKHPTVLAMQILRQILSEQNRIGIFSARHDSLSLQPTPEWNPGSMVSHRLETSPWRTRKFMNYKWILPYIGLLFLFVIFYYSIN